LDAAPIPGEERVPSWRLPGMLAREPRVAYANPAGFAANARKRERPGSLNEADAETAWSLAASINQREYRWSFARSDV